MGCHAGRTPARRGAAASAIVRGLHRPQRAWFARMSSEPRRPALPASLAAICAAVLAACTTPPAAPPLTLDRPVVLLGEVHDNAAQHALRLAAFEALLARGARPALLMEQFDRDRQGAIDAYRARARTPDADALIAAATGGAKSGWHWAFYRPFVALALQHGLPIVAANIGRTEARHIMNDGLAAQGFDAAVPAEVLDGIAAEVQAGHCGLVDAPTARRMALAQVARDQAMARAVEAHADRGAVLLAGNGHVRTDLGVPRWLDPATRLRSEAIGLLEAGDPTAAYDRRVFTPAQARTDPCRGMQAPAR